MLVMCSGLVVARHVTMEVRMKFVLDWEIRENWLVAKALIKPPDEPTAGLKCSASSDEGRKVLALNLLIVSSFVSCRKTVLGLMLINSESTSPHFKTWPRPLMFQEAKVKR